jgi:hypothetical protein
MKLSALTTLAEGIADAMGDGATASDITRIFDNPAARDELMHESQRLASGAAGDAALLRSLVFGLRAHGGVEIELEEEDV